MDTTEELLKELVPTFSNINRLSVRLDKSLSELEPLLNEKTIRDLLQEEGVGVKLKF